MWVAGSPHSASPALPESCSGTPVFYKWFYLHIKEPVLHCCRIITAIKMVSSQVFEKSSVALFSVDLPFSPSASDSIWRSTLLFFEHGEKKPIVSRICLFERMLTSLSALSTSPHLYCSTLAICLSICFCVPRFSLDLGLSGGKVWSVWTQRQCFRSTVFSLFCFLTFMGISRRGCGVVNRDTFKYILEEQT